MAHTPIEIRQFSLSQYDIPNGSMACTAISMVAGAHFLKNRGRTRRCLWSDERASEVIRVGVRLHTAWVRENGEAAKLALVSPDEMVGMPQIRGTLQLGTCLFGQYGSDDLGLTLSQAIDAIGREFAADKNKKAAAYVLTTQAHTTMLGVRRERYHASRGNGGNHYASGGQTFRLKYTIFDSHTRDKVTGLHIKNGKAVTVRLADAPTLLTYLGRLYDTQRKPAEAFTLHEVSLPPEAGVPDSSDESVCRVSSVPSVGSVADLAADKTASSPYITAVEIGIGSSASMLSDDTQSSGSDGAGQGGNQLARRLSRLLSITGRRQSAQGS